MTVEDGLDDRFPVGMRVLAVDDDPTCLLVLGNLLRQCDYRVTTTNETIKALKLLRESKDKFDLVISDVHMPDLDGFKLLELVGFEMDLPVIMLSGNSDTSLVMKGITHGACDYLIKPVRKEELKNIWQHVIRRRYDPKEKRHHGHGHGDDQYKLTEEGKQGQGKGESADLQLKVLKKRRDQNEEDDDFDENAHNKDSSTQKKPRVVWTADLQKKFVAAVNQLGLDKAVPKKILDVMNVDYLTRENVASHLQKYRLCLGRLSKVTAQKDNMSAAALEMKDILDLPITSYNGLQNVCLMNGTELPPKFSLAYSHAGRATGQTTNPWSLGIGGLSSSGIMKYGSQYQLSRNLLNNMGNLQPPLNMGNQQGTSLPGVAQSLKLDEMQQISFSTSPDDLIVGPVRQRQVINAEGPSSSTMVGINMESAVFDLTNTGFKGPYQSAFSEKLEMPFPSFVGRQSQDELVNVGEGVSCQEPDHSRINGTWRCEVPLNEFTSATLPVTGVSFGGNRFPLENSLSLSKTEVELHGPSLRDACESTVRDVPVGSNAKLSNGRKINKNSGQIRTHAMFQTLNGHPLFAPDSNSFLPPDRDMAPFVDGSFNQNMKLGLSGQSVIESSYPLHNPVMGKSTNGNHIENHGHSSKVQGDLTPNKKCSSFEDLMGTLMMQDGLEESLLDGDIGLDIFP